MKKQNENIITQGYQDQSNSLKIYSKNMTKIIGENIFLLGFSGDEVLVVHMSNKIYEMFGEVDVDVLNNIFEDYLSGKIDCRYGFNISHITRELRNRGLLTKKEIEDRKNGPKMIY